MKMEKFLILAVIIQNKLYGDLISKYNLKNKKTTYKI